MTKKLQLPVRAHLEDAGNGQENGEMISGSCLRSSRIGSSISLAGVP